MYNFVLFILGLALGVVVAKKYKFWRAERRLWQKEFSVYSSTETRECMLVPPGLGNTHKSMMKAMAKASAQASRNRGWPMKKRNLLSYVFGKNTGGQNEKD